MNPDDALTPPLTLDEALQLAGRLAEKGHWDAASDLMHAAISANVVPAVAAACAAANR